MSLATLEREITEEARTVLNNPKLRKKDILEWSTGPVHPDENEVAVHLGKLVINVCVPKVCDKRAKL